MPDLVLLVLAVAQLLVVSLLLLLQHTLDRVLRILRDDRPETWS